MQARAQQRVGHVQRAGLQVAGGVGEVRHLGATGPPGPRGRPRPPPRPPPGPASGPGPGAGFSQGLGRGGGPGCGGMVPAEARVGGLLRAGRAAGGATVRALLLPSSLVFFYYTVSSRRFWPWCRKVGAVFGGSGPRARVGRGRKGKRRGGQFARGGGGIWARDAGRCAGRVCGAGAGYSVDMWVSIYLLSSSVRRGRGARLRAGWEGRVLVSPAGGGGGWQGARGPHLGPSWARSLSSSLRLLPLRPGLMPSPRPFP